MKIRIPLLAFGLAAAAPWALATEYGQVISSTPVTAQVAVPSQQCQDTQQAVAAPTTGAGSLIGAIVGGAIGNSVGGGFGRAAATGLGVVAGAAIGDRFEANATPPALATVRSCQTVTGYQIRTLGYDVTYEYQGRRYTTRMAQPPGERIALDVQVAPAGAGAAPVYAAAPAVAPAVVYAPAPVYAYGYGGYYVAPVVSVVPRVVIGGYWRHRY